MKKLLAVAWVCLMFAFAQAQDPPGETPAAVPSTSAEAVAPGLFSLDKKVFTALEGQPLTIRVYRGGGSDGAVSVRFSTVAGSAVAGRDFTGVDQVIHFEDGDSKPKAVTLSVTKDIGLEFPEKFKVTLSQPTGGASLGKISAAKVTIVMFSNQAVVFGLLMFLLAFVFVSSHSDRPGWRRFYKFVPTLLVCYFLPSVFGTLGIIGSVSDGPTPIYWVASRVLLPACLVLLCLSIDFKGMMRLGPKALIMFFTGTVGIVIGGPVAFLIVSWFSPEAVGGAGPDAVWRGMTTVAGSWIGGGANQTAMKEVFEVGDQIFSAMIAVDILVGNIWLAVLLYMAGNSDKFDAKLKADNSAIKEVQTKIADYQSQLAKIPNLTDTMKIAGVAFAITAIAHLLADIIAPSLKQSWPVLEVMSLTSTFFWMIVFSTLGGLALSFTKAREMEGAGASRLGSAFLYVLIASIGMKMDLMAVVRYWELFIVGGIWISCHAGLLLIVARVIRAPVFFLAVGSQANVGGAASAPIVASAFHPSLAPVGVMLAVFGYALGTFAAYFCGQLLRVLAGG